MSNITDDINYSKAVWEQLRRWRIVRKPLLATLDIEFMKALEQDDNAKKAAVIQQKEELRNITNYDFTTATSVESIFEIWPTILGEIPEEFCVNKYQDNTK